MTPCARRLGNDSAAQEHAKMTHGPNSDDSTKKDKEAPELATLSDKKILILSERLVSPLRADTE